MADQPDESRGFHRGIGPFRHDDSGATVELENFCSARMGLMDDDGRFRSSGYRVVHGYKPLLSLALSDGRRNPPTISATCGKMGRPSDFPTSKVRR
jgi:hypothetical protein